MSLHNRTIWLLFQLDYVKDMAFGIAKTTEYRLEDSAYIQGLLEGLNNVYVFYDPRILQRIVSNMESIGIEVRDITI